MLIYLGTVRSFLLIRHAGSLSHALRVMRRGQGSVGYGVGKMIKAETAVRDAGTKVGAVDVNKVRATIRGDLIANERLRALRAAPM